MPKTNAERVHAYKERRRVRNMERLEVWTYPELKEKIRDIVKKMNEHWSD